MESIIDRNRCYRASRQFAIKWFREFNTTERQALCDKFEEFGFRRTCTTLTGSEIVRLFEAEIRANNEVLEDLLNIVEENVISMCCKHVNTPFVNPEENPIELELQPIYVSEFDNSEPVVVFQSPLVSSVSFTMGISPIKDNYYSDKKFVKAGGGTIYAGIEKSAKWYINLNGGKIAKNAKEPEITKQLSKINKTALGMFNDLYSYFYIAVHYNDNSSVKKIKESIGIANKFIALLKPFDLPHQYKRGGNIWKELSGKPISNKSLK